MSTTERDLRIMDAEKWLYEPLPTVEELVGPIVRTFHVLAKLGARVEELTWLTEFGGDRAGDAARKTLALRALLHEVVRQVGVGAHRNVPRPNQEQASTAARQTVELLGQVMSLDNWAEADQVDDLAWGPAEGGAS